MNLLRKPNGYGELCWFLRWHLANCTGFIIARRYCRLALKLCHSDFAGLSKASITLAAACGSEIMLS